MRRGIESLDETDDRLAGGIQRLEEWALVHKLALVLLNRGLECRVVCFEVRDVHRRTVDRVLQRVGRCLDPGLIRLELAAGIVVDRVLGYRTGFGEHGSKECCELPDWIGRKSENIEEDRPAS